MNVSYRTAQWLLLAAFLAHNAEEGATIRFYLPRALKIVSGITGDGPLLPPVDVAMFMWTLLIVSLLACVAVLLGSRRPILPVLLASVMLTNVLIPHVPAAVAFGGYAPGLITALLVNAPMGVWFIRRSVHEQFVTKYGVGVAMAVSPILIAGAVALSFVIVDRVRLALALWL